MFRSVVAIDFYAGRAKMTWLLLCVIGTSLGLEHPFEVDLCFVHALDNELAVFPAHENRPAFRAEIEIHLIPAV